MTDLRVLLGVHLPGMAWTPTADALVTLARGDDYTGRLDIVTVSTPTVAGGAGRGLSGQNVRRTEPCRLRGRPT